MSWVDCELSHGPRKVGTKCQACAALEEVGQLRAELTRRQLVKDEDDETIARLRDRVAQLEQALELIAAPKRKDGTYNRSREACEQIARAALDGRDEKGKGV